MRQRTLVWVGALAFLLFALFTTPVALLYGWFGPKAGPVQLFGLEGSIAEGRLAGVAFNARPTLGALHWRFQPWSLLLARAGFHVDGGGEAITLDGRLDLLPGGGINLGDARIAGGLKSVLALAGQAFLPVDGQAGLQLDRLKLRKGFPTAADGRLQVAGVAWTLARDPVALGDYEAVLATQNDRIVATVKPLAGPLDVGGEVRLLTTDRAYEVDLQIKPKPEAPPMVQNLVRSLGQPDTQGYWHVRTRGALGPPTAVPPGAVTR